MTALPRIGNYHAVTPGPVNDPEPDTFSAGLPGLLAAMSAAAKVPRDGVPREITLVSGREVTVICTITDGVAAWPPGRAVVPARKTPRKKERKGKRP